MVLGWDNDLTLFGFKHFSNFYFWWIFYHVGEEILLSLIRIFYGS